MTLLAVACQYGRTKQHVKADQAEIVENEKETSESEGEFIEQPAKVMRVGSMLRQLLDELREVQLDEGSRDRCEIFTILLSRARFCTFRRIKERTRPHNFAIWHR
ncbi:MAG: hypothetical protein CM15mP49_01550 [Actinomycetota bacterium]|nr:MAG: hypothetical protein CM15mP49_01550 [Actinomycetota bacterium]